MIVQRILAADSVVTAQKPFSAMPGASTGMQTRSSESQHSLGTGYKKPSSPLLLAQDLLLKDCSHASPNTMHPCMVSLLHPVSGWLTCRTHHTVISYWVISFSDPALTKHSHMYVYFGIPLNVLPPPPLHPLCTQYASPAWLWCVPARSVLGPSVGLGPRCGVVVVFGLFNAPRPPPVAFKTKMTTVTRTSGVSHGGVGWGVVPARETGQYIYIYICAPYL